MRRPARRLAVDDFCSDECQQAWHAARADALVGYREPWDRPEDFPPGVIPPEAFEDDVPPIPPALPRAVIDQALGVVMGQNCAAPPLGPAFHESARELAAGLIVGEAEPRKGLIMTSEVIATLSLRSYVTQ